MDAQKTSMGRIDAISDEMLGLCRMRADTVPDPPFYAALESYSTSDRSYPDSRYDLCSNNPIIRLCCAWIRS